MVWVDFSTKGMSLGPRVQSSKISQRMRFASAWLQMASDGFRWLQMASDGFRWLQMASGQHVGKKGWISVTSGTSLHMLSAITNALRLVLLKGQCHAKHPKQSVHLLLSLQLLSSLSLSPRRISGITTAKAGVSTFAVQTTD